MSNSTNVTNVVLVTGPAGAGRSTAINILEDLGYETIDNMPFSLVEQFLNGQRLDRPLALGMDPRTRGFDVKTVLETVAMIEEHEAYSSTLLYVDCSTDVLLRRYSETRRRHPAAPEESPQQGIELEKDLLRAIKSRADIYINTTEMSPHDLKAEVSAALGDDLSSFLAVNLQSFSYKRGVPRGIDMVLDCRFLRNPYWDESLRGLTGMDDAVRKFVKEDARYATFFDQTQELVKFLLPAYREEGKSHFTIGMGCTGGQHRSVSVAEELAIVLAQSGWQVSVRHREMERRAGPVKE